MKLNSKNRATFASIVILAMVIGTLSWEIIERILTVAGLPIDLSVGPLQLDAYVVAVTLRPNPGTVIGVFPGIALFRRV